MKILNLMILATLFKENKYGLQIIKDIKNVSKLEIDLKLPSLYNSIKRMEGYGYLESYWENSEIGGKRRYCSLTEKGRNHLISQVENLSEEDKTMIKNLMDNIQQPVKVDKEINKEQDFSLSQSPIAIQPNFLSQCYDNNEYDSNEKEDSILSQTKQNDIDSNNEQSYEQFSMVEDNNSNDKQSYNFKDIFGDIVYENIEKESTNDNNTKSDKEEQKLEENSSLFFDNSQISKEEGLIIDKQFLDENYKVNITLKTENSSNKEKQLAIENSRDLLFNTSPNQKKDIPPNTQQLDIKPQESNIMSKCLQNFDKLGITYSLYSKYVDIKTKEKNFDENTTKKFYRNKFKLMQLSVTSLISFLLLLCVYISLDIIGKISTLQTSLYIAFFVGIIALIVVYLIKCIKEPNQLYEYKKIKTKSLVNKIYMACILTLVVVAICFFCGMTFSTIKYYLSFIIMPVLILAVVFINYLIEIIMVKNSKYFINT